MPQLNKTTAKKVADSSSSFEPIPAGAYHARLVNVDADRKGPAGPYWSWEFDVVEPGHENRKLWNNTSMSEAALFSLQQTFEAFGVEPDTDTDELIGEVVKLVVSVRTIQDGPRKGELANQINRLMPKDDDFEAPEAPTPATEEDIFS